MADSRRPSRSRFTVQTPPPRSRAKRAGKSGRSGGSPEIWVAISVIVAAALATFGALFLTSRPFDPMNASLAPQQVVPAGPGFSPSPKPSPSNTPAPSPPGEVSPGTPGGETASETPDDATIQTRIESALAADSAVAKLDVSTLVENGRVTIVGSVNSPELKQRVYRIVRGVRGVAGVENQLVVAEATP